ncbi:hypothetical protein ACFE04_031112 [Oxalis oulophora]
METVRTVKDAPPHGFVKSYVARLKHSGKELAPYDPDRYYIRGGMYLGKWCKRAQASTPISGDSIAVGVDDALEGTGNGIQPTESKVAHEVKLMAQIPCQSNEFVLELLRGVRLHFDRFIKVLKSDQEAISELLRVERDSELEYTQEELNDVPTPDESSETSKPIEFLVSHGKAPQELCDTICNLNAVSTSIGLGGMHLVMFRVERNHRLPPTTLSPGDMVCVRICDRRGAGATSCIQGFVNNLGEDGCSISIALESRHGDPTFSKLFGKSVRIDRIPRLADTLTYERNCEALMLLRKNGLLKKNPSINIVATLFGDQEDVSYLQENHLVDWDEAELDGKSESENFDDSQRKEMQNMRNCYDSLLSAAAATTNIAYGSGYAVVTHRDPLLMAKSTRFNIDGRS